LGKYFYCPKCGDFPDEITEHYPSPLVERRKWNGEYYELVESNIDSAEHEINRKCGKCGAKLIEKD